MLVLTGLLLFLYLAVVSATQDRIRRLITPASLVQGRREAFRSHRYLNSPFYMTEWDNDDNA
jgi:hypothetical protein